MKDWIPEIFETCEAGASSAFEPELIPQNQLSWLKNGAIRGGKAATRMGLRECLVLPDGRIQGGSYFSVQGGMLVLQIGGRPYRIRIDNRSFSSSAIPLDWYNSSKVPLSWMQETVGSLVIQDGQSLPIIYDGSTARRSDVDNLEVPLGRMMAYGNGRLWVAINENEVVAGDIKTRDFQSELQFTETQYLTGGGAFYFPRKLTALGFIPASGAAGYGSLLVFAKDYTESIRADVAYRDLWAQMPGFIQPLLLNTGAAGQFSLVEVNQDLYWRDGQGGIRSLRSAMADEAGGPGNSPLSREVSRLVDYENLKRLDACSAIQFQNRLLMTASPFINDLGGTSFKDLISLDFSPLSSMRGKSMPSYDGEWEGINFVRLFKGKFRGNERAFAVSRDYDGNNRLWEFDPNARSDRISVCVGTSQVDTDVDIPMVVEYPRRNWGDPKRRKRLERCDVYLSGLDGESELEVYWRPDNYQKWLEWDSVEMCATTSDDSTATPHVWMNLRNQERPQVKTFSIPQNISAITNYALHTGFEFQVRLVLRGKGKVHRTAIYASMLDEESFANRNSEFADCLLNDVTGNEITHELDPEYCSAGTSIIQYRFRAGTATLVGYSELTSPSTPPKKYLTATWSGTMSAIDFNDGACTLPNGGSKVETVSGSCTYNASTGVLTNGSRLVTVINGVTTYDGPFNCVPTGPFCGISSVLTQTTETRTGTGVCCQNSFTWIHFVGGSLFTLSNEDTEAAAIARLFPDEDEGWSAYSSISTGCALAQYELRGAGDFGLAVRQTQFRVTGSGYIPNKSLTVSLPVYRRTLGSSDDYTLYETLVYDVDTDASGAFVIIDDTPNTQGYETYVAKDVGQLPGVC